MRPLWWWRVGGSRTRATGVEVGAGFVRSCAARMGGACSRVCVCLQLCVCSSVGCVVVGWLVAGCRSLRGFHRRRLDEARDLVDLVGRACESRTTPSGWTKERRTRETGMPNRQRIRCFSKRARFCFDSLSASCACIHASAWIRTARWRCMRQVGRAGTA